MVINAGVAVFKRPKVKPFLRHPFTYVIGADYYVTRMWKLIRGERVRNALADAGYDFLDFSCGAGDHVDPYVDIKTTKGMVRVMYNDPSDSEQPKELWFYALD